MTLIKTVTPKIPRSTEEPLQRQNLPTWPLFIANIVCGLALMATFITLFFFTVVKNVEEQLLTDNVNIVVDSLTGSITSMTPEEWLNNYKTTLNNTLVLSSSQTESLDAKDQDVAKSNRKLMIQSIIATSLLVFVCIFIVILVWFIGSCPDQSNPTKKLRPFSMVKLLMVNTVLTGCVALTYYTFLITFGSSYRMADINKLQNRAVSACMKYADVSSNLI